MAFRKNWQRDQNDAAIRVTTADMERTFSTSAGSMTLYLELLDGASGQISARAADRGHLP